MIDTNKCCATCKHFESFGAWSGEGYCQWPVPEDLPEWVDWASNMKHRIEGKRCVVWEAAK